MAPFVEGGSNTPLYDALDDVRHFSVRLSDYRDFDPNKFDHLAEEIGEGTSLGKKMGFIALYKGTNKPSDLMYFLNFNAVRILIGDLIRDGKASEIKCAGIAYVDCRAPDDAKLLRRALFEDADLIPRDTLTPKQIQDYFRMIIVPKLRDFFHIGRIEPASNK